MKLYEPGYFDRLRAKRPYPVTGWRQNTLPTESENAAASASLEKMRARQEANKPIVVKFSGIEFGRKAYLHELAALLAGAPHNYLKNSQMATFLHGPGSGGRKVERKRTSWGLYFNVTQFEKAWQKRLTALRRIEKPVQDS